MSAPATVRSPPAVTFRSSPVLPNRHKPQVLPGGNCAVADAEMVSDATRAIVPKMVGIERGGIMTRARRRPGSNEMHALEFTGPSGWSVSAPESEQLIH